MAMIKCKECGKDISEHASKCPNCGCPKNTVEISKKGMTILRSIEILLIIGLIISCIYYNKSYNNYQKTVRPKQNKTYYSYYNF